MNTPVSFELAKLVKEKRFDIATKILYNDEGYKLNNGYYPDIHKEDIAAPTIAEVVMWLYEKHGIWIEVVKPVRQKLFRFNVDNKDDINEFTSVVCFNSPTEAYSAAIEYTLNNLI